MFFGYLWIIPLFILLVAIAVIFFNVGKLEALKKLVPFIKRVKFKDEDFRDNRFASAYKKYITCARFWA